MSLGALRPKQIEQAVFTPSDFDVGLLSVLGI